MRKQQAAIIYALLAVFFWSTVATAFKIALRYYSPLQLIFISSLVSLVVFGIIIIATGRTQKLFSQNKRQLWHSAILGFLSPTAYYLILFEAYRRLPAQVAQPLNYVWTIVLVLLAAPLLHQPLSLRKIAGVIVGFTGAFIIATQGKLTSFRIEEPVGTALALFSSVAWALFWIFNTRDKRDDVIKLFTNFVFGALYLTVIMFWQKGFDFPAGKEILAPVYIGIFEMGLTFYLWMKAMELTDSSAKISNLVFLSPFLSLVFIHYILGEKLYYTTFLGLTLIIAGIFINRK